MKKTIKTIITICSIILIIAIITIIKAVASNMSKIPENEPYDAGFTAGNIYNKGYFAEKNGRVYFANAYDNYNLYSMNPDQSDIKKIAGGNIEFINVLGNYVYYYTQTSGDQAGLGYVRNGRGLYRTDINGKNTYSLAKCTTTGMVAVGNHLYFSYFAEGKNDNADITIQRITTSNEDQQIIINENIALGGYYNGNLIYAGVDGNHHLYSYNLSTKISEKISDINAYMPMYSNGYIYYLDLDSEYQLNRIALSDGTIQTIVAERVDTYNICNDTIVYQNVNPDNYALKRVNVNGGEPEVIASGVYRDINVTSTYIYFRSFNNELPVYQIPANGGTSVSTFDAALNAAMGN